MKFLEADLEKIIMSIPNRDLRAAGLQIYGRKRNQIRIGNYGICDVASITTNHIENYYTVDIWELKQDCIDWKTLEQSLRYAKGVMNYLNNFKEFLPDMELRITINMVGRRINLKDSFIYLADIFGTSREDIINFYTYDYLFDGIKFTKVKNYQIINEGF
jgi:hypothetical protein